MLLYKLLKLLLTIPIFLIVKINVKNIENIPPVGPVILACNHRSDWDPVILGIISPRDIHFMAKEELFKIFLLGTIIKNIGAFPVKRGAADRNAIRLALKVLKDEKVLGIFPEGTRSKTGELKEFQSGVILLAHKGNAPIIPIGMTNTNNILKNFFKRPTLNVNIGEPIYIEKSLNGKINSEQIEEYNTLLFNKVKNLLEIRK